MKLLRPVWRKLWIEGFILQHFSLIKLFKSKLYHFRYKWWNVNKGKKTIKSEPKYFWQRVCLEDVLTRLFF